MSKIADTVVALIKTTEMNAHDCRDRPAVTRECEQALFEREFDFGRCHLWLFAVRGSGGSVGAASLPSRPSRPERTANTHVVSVPSLAVVSALA
jgi:hypothetical protein